MASKEFFRLFQDKKLSAATHKGLARRFETLLVCFTVLALTYIALLKLLSVEVPKLAMIPSPRYNNGTVQASQPLFSSAPVTSSPTWTFNATAFEHMRQTAAKLHPNVFLMNSTLGILAAPACKRKPCRTKSNVGNYTTCAIVGNSGILLGSQCGNDIDAKEYIIRIDLPAVTEFRTDVGQKSHMTIVNGDTARRLHESSLMANQTRDVYRSRLENINGSVLVGYKEKWRALQNATEHHRLSFDFMYSRVKGGLRKSHIINPVATKVAGWKFHNRPSSGLSAILIASTFCDRLYLYGFYPYRQDRNKRPIPYHYFPGDYVDRPIKLLKKHHMPKEYKLYKQLHERGALKLQVGQCDN